MNCIQCTWVTYDDWTKKIIYYVDEITDSTNISTISYPMLTSEEIEEIKEVTIEKLQKLLSKYF